MVHSNGLLWRDSLDDAAVDGALADGADCFTVRYGVKLWNASAEVKRTADDVCSCRKGKTLFCVSWYLANQCHL